MPLDTRETTFPCVPRGKPPGPSIFSWKIYASSSLTSRYIVSSGLVKSTGEEYLRTTTAPANAAIS